MRQSGKLVRFQDPFGDVVFAEEFVLRWDDGLEDVAAAYRERMRVSVDLALIAPEDRRLTVDELAALIAEDDGEVWETSDSSWLLTPRHPRSGSPESGGPWLSGDREPRIPVEPTTSGAVSVEVPREEG